MDPSIAENMEGQLYKRAEYDLTLATLFCHETAEKMSRIAGGLEYIVEAATEVNKAHAKAMKRHIPPIVPCGDV